MTSNLNFLLTSRFTYNYDRSKSKYIKYVNLKKHSLNIRKNFNLISVKLLTQVRLKKVFRTFSVFGEDFNRIIFRN